MISLLMRCWFYMYFISKYFTVFVFIGQYAKCWINGIFTFMWFTWNVKGAKIVLDGDGSWMGANLNTLLWHCNNSNFLASKKQPSRSMLVHILDCELFAQSEIISFLLLLGSYFQIWQCSSYQFYFSIHG